ncbi:chemotaxis protein CheW [Marinobacter sp. X15-166B]|nr:chemotaxis protein CheW [Marinobacter sp. X15-166B]
MVDESFEPADALSSYLDDLLKTATQEAAQEDRVLAEEVPVVAPAPVTALPIPAAAEPAALPESTGRPDIHEPADQPEWAGRPFECLIFKVAGLQLAVPLVLLGAIQRLDDAVTPLPGSPAWYMGMLPGADRNIRVVDTAQWVMAGRVPADARADYRFVIRLNDSEWGLACDQVAQSFTLRPEQVKWRTARSKRPWLAGTVTSHMCALIDVGAMASLLSRAEREQHLSLE